MFFYFVVDKPFCELRSDDAKRKALWSLLSKYLLYQAYLYLWLKLLYPALSCPWSSPPSIYSPYKYPCKLDNKQLVIYQHSTMLQKQGQV